MKSPNPSGPAVLDTALISRVLNAFPTKQGWQLENCRDFEHDQVRSLRRVDWRTTDCGLPTHAGVYAFIFPLDSFLSSFTICLKGPTRDGVSQRIPFKVHPAKLPAPIRGHFVSYVGRSSNVRERILLHFHATRSTTAAQVRGFLVESSLGLTPYEAIDFMCQHAMIAYYSLPYSRNVANRDIIEVGLWAKYRSPFNIKSER